MPRPPKHHPETLFNLKKLKAHRLARGLSMSDVGRLLGIAPGDYFHYESGGVTLPIYHFRKLCILWNLDLFEIVELLKLFPVKGDYLAVFRGACRKEGKTPAQVLLEFIKIYAGLI